MANSSNVSMKPFKFQNAVIDTALDLQIWTGSVRQKPGPYFLFFCHFPLFTNAL